MTGAITCGVPHLLKIGEEALEELMRAETNQQFAAAGQKSRKVLEGIE